MSNFMSHNLSRLTTFSGRDTRAQFWPYAGILVVAYMAVFFLVMMTQMSPLVAEAQAFALAHPELADGRPVDANQLPDSVKAESLQMAQTAGDLFGAVMLANSIILVVVAALFAAAVVRRLHDRGLSGWWGLMPLPFLLFALIAMPRVFSDFATPTGPDIGLFGLIFINNLIYNVVLVILIVFLAKRSDPGINRYGPPPAVQP